VDGGLVDEAEDNADDDPLNKVCDGLLDGKFEADVQVDVVVNDKGADGEDANECSEARTFDGA